jgi:TctA family transporter
MSLLEVLLVVVAYIIAMGLIALLDRALAPKLNYPRWAIYVAYVLVTAIVIIYVCNALGVFGLLNRVRA